MNNTKPPEFQTPLRRLIASHGLSEGKVADAVGIDRGHFNRICKGAPAGRKAAEKIVDYFDQLTGKPGSISEMELIYPERFMQKDDQ
jgi:hypothetical protein